MSYYEGTYIDRLPLELQDRIGVPVVVGRLVTLPVEVLDHILDILRQTVAADRINASIRSLLLRFRLLKRNPDVFWSWSWAEARRYLGLRYVRRRADLLGGGHVTWTN